MVRDIPALSKQQRKDTSMTTSNNGAIAIATPTELVACPDVLAQEH